MNIGSWLRSLGLEQYEAAFRENEINENVLPKLTAEDLKELGVNALGHRRTLLDAIAALRAETTTKASSPEAPPTVPQPIQDTAERRQVTVMFSDLVGSTALSARMDPEDLREVISAYQKCVAETVQRFGGFVAKYMGDGVLVYFGYPQAHEDDAERAVRAGLELIQAVGGLKSSAPLQTRVGIATGLVVVGDLIGSGVAQEQAVVGETPNLAARLQGIAEPNTVVIAEGTRKLIGNLFDLQDLGVTNFKGITGPVRTWAALRASSVASRFEALHATGLTALVGREEELELLQRRWSKAKTGEGHVVLLSGEAGIGKSRLTAALLETIANDPHIRLRYFCSPQHTDSAFYPIIGQIARAAKLAHDDTLQAKLDKLDALLAQTSPSKQDAVLIAELLSLPNDGRYPTLELTREKRRQRTLEALISQLQALTRAKPLLMIVEDAHWTDPSSLEVFGRVVDRIATLRALLIVTFRPEFEPPWVGRSYVTALTLNRLTRRELDAMIDRVVGNKPIPAAIRQDIVERTDGIPLFVEEVTKAVLEAESDDDAKRTAGVLPFPARAVPASLHASLMARLDRLGSAKEVAQIGAALGREFSHALLAAVARNPEPELASALTRLIATGLLFRQGVPPHATYLFKHALVQDAAYGSLLREPRRALHSRIVDVFESQFTEISESQPELLARHCTEAGLIEKAMVLWGKAGQRSLQRSAAVEASEQLTRAVSQIALLPSSPALRRQEITFQVALANALMHTKGYAASETRSAFDQARSLIERVEALGESPEDPLLLFSVLYGFWVANFVAFNGEALLELAAQFLALAEKQAASGPIVIGHRLLASSLASTGDLVKGKAHYDMAFALYDPAKHRALATRFGQDVRVVILSLRAVILWILGYPDQARADAEGALADARETGHAVTLMYALLNAAVLHIHRGNYQEASSFDNELTVLAEQAEAPFYKAVSVAQRGCIFSLTGNPSAAVDTITSGVRAWRLTGATLWMTMFLPHLANAYAESAQFDDAWRCIRDAVTFIETTKERWWEAEVHRTAGEIALHSPDQDTVKAEAYFERALSVARQQQAKSWELRAAMSMARLWRDQGKRNEARELLAPVYGWFTEGFDTRDLKVAKALLDQLGS